MSTNPNSTDTLDMLTFSMGNTSYCIPTGKVVMVSQKEEIISVPQPKEAIEGMILYQSRLIPILDLEFLLHRQKMDNHFIVIIEHPTFWYALMIGNVDCVLTVPMSQIHYPNQASGLEAPQYVRAVVSGAEKHFVLNLEAISNYICRN